MGSERSAPTSRAATQLAPRPGRGPRLFLSLHRGSSRPAQCPQRQRFAYRNARRRVAQRARTPEPQGRTLTGVASSLIADETLCRDSAQLAAERPAVHGKRPCAVEGRSRDITLLVSAATCSRAGATRSTDQAHKNNDRNAHRLERYTTASRGIAGCAAHCLFAFARLFPVLLLVPAGDLVGASGRLSGWPALPRRRARSGARGDGPGWLQGLGRIGRPLAARGPPTAVTDARLVETPASQQSPGTCPPCGYGLAKPKCRAVHPLSPPLWVFPTCKLLVVRFPALQVNRCLASLSIGRRQS